MITMVKGIQSSTLHKKTLMWAKLAQAIKMPICTVGGITKAYFGKWEVLFCFPQKPNLLWGLQPRKVLVLFDAAAIQGSGADC